MQPLHGHFLTFTVRLDLFLFIDKCTTPLQTTICHTSPDIGRYADYLKGVYENSSVCDDQKFPPTPSQKYVNLAVVNHKPRDIDEVMKYTLYGNVEELIENKEKISIEEILKPKDQSRLRLVLVEGPPGVGKSTLSWELCRRWDKIPHMREYSLVMLLRLRENSVQQAKAVADLFYHVDSDLQQSVVKEVVTTEGKGVLFILDGFDELPSGLRRNGLLIDLITGRALPKSTVIVTSRPSATADLLGKCRSQVQKRVEILGFTQECVKEYASTVFSSEPKLLDDFLAYISASNNPAINSLMYIPLNAAIIMELYRNSKRIGGPIPKTLTQLYSVLCLTLIQRYLDNEQPLNRFTDLTEKDYRHFLDLSEVAFHGIKEREVVFSSDRLSKNLVHFGFLDVVSSLYSGPGGGDSYNFLHLTVQEFLAAYHISQLPHQKGLELFEQHGRDGPWHVVWIFVAGLTGFELFKGISMKSEAFVNKTKDDKLNLSGMLIHCLYEAQINESEYSAIFEGSSNVEITFVHAPLDKYALGYCIARSPPTIFWDVGLYGGSSDSLIWGLRSRAKCKGIMKTLDLDSCFLSANLKECPTNILQSITHFCMKEDSFYKHDPAVYTHLCESIPSLCNLSTLKLRPQQPFQEADLIMLLDKISTSKVSYLIIGSLHHDILEKEQIILAMSKLIHPLSGTLQNLAIFQHVSKIIDTQTSLCTVLYNSSSLRELYVGFHNPSPLALLETNTCLTRITIECFWNKEHAESIASLLQKNTTLRCLILKFLHCQNQIELLKIITCNIEANTALQRFEFHTDGVNAILQELSRLKNDPRIHYHNYYTGECFYKHSLVSGKRILW